MRLLVYGPKEYWFFALYVSNRGQEARQFANRFDCICMCFTIGLSLGTPIRLSIADAHRSSVRLESGLGWSHRSIPFCTHDLHLAHLHTGASCVSPIFSRVT